MQYNFNKFDSVISSFKRIDRKIKKREKIYKHIIQAQDIYLGSLINRKEAFEEDIDRYQTSTILFPVLEIKNSRTSLENYIYPLLKSKISLDKIPEIIQKKIIDYENEISEILKQKSVKVDNPSENFIYYILRDLIHEHNYSGKFYEKIGSDLEEMFFNEENLRSYERFEKEYLGIGKEIPKKNQFRNERTKLTAKKLGQEHILILNYLKNIEN